MATRTHSRSSALSSTGASNQFGNAEKTSYNKLTGYTKIDNRPDAGPMNNYAIQVRTDVLNTSGQQWGVDCEAHLDATGTASVRAVQGVAVNNATFTATTSTLIGTYGQARNDGTLAGSSFMAGLYGLIEEGGGTTAATHVASCWLDTHHDSAITGSYQLLYMTENGDTALDQVIYMRTPAAVVFAEFDTCTAFMGSGAKSGGTAKTIKISIDGVTHYINAWPS